MTAVKLVQLSTSRLQGKIPLIRVRNPWGNEAEWKGAWSDKYANILIISTLITTISRSLRTFGALFSNFLLFRSREWSVVSDREKKDLGIIFDADGEFWMAFTDFKNNFTRLEICNISPDSLEEGLSQLIIF